MKHFKIHPAADLFPDMSADQYQELKEDIKRDKHHGGPGVKEPVVLARDGSLLDGRHRAKVCQELHINCPTRVLPVGVDPVSYSISVNLKRRHLTASQLAMVAAAIANGHLGSNQFTKKSTSTAGPSSHAPDVPEEDVPEEDVPNPDAFDDDEDWEDAEDSDDELCEKMGISKSMLTRGKYVNANGPQSLIDMVKGKELSVTAAYDILHLKTPPQLRKLCQAGPDAIRGALKQHAPKETDTPKDTETNQMSPAKRREGVERFLAKAMDEASVLHEQVGGDWYQPFREAIVATASKYLKGIK